MSADTTEEFGSVSSAAFGILDISTVGGGCILILVLIRMRNWVVPLFYPLRVRGTIHAVRYIYVTGMLCAEMHTAVRGVT